MSIITSSTRPSTEPSSEFYHVTLSFQVAAPTSIDPTTPLAPSMLINNNIILLQTQLDILRHETIEPLRKTWLEALDREDISFEEKPTTVEDIFSRVLQETQNNEDRKLMINLVNSAKFPIPTDYIIALPMPSKNQEHSNGILLTTSSPNHISKQDRQHIIRSLVPFNNACSMLLRFEDSLKLPIRSIRIKSQREAGLSNLSKITFN